MLALETVLFAPPSASAEGLRYSVVESPSEQHFEALLNGTTEKIIDSGHLVDVKVGRTRSTFHALFIWKGKQV